MNTCSVVLQPLFSALIDLIAFIYVHTFVGLYCTVFMVLVVSLLWSGDFSLYSNVMFFSCSNFFCIPHYFTIEAQRKNKTIGTPV